MPWPSAPIASVPAVLRNRPTRNPANQPGVKAATRLDVAVGRAGRRILGLRRQKPPPGRGSRSERRDLRSTSRGTSRPSLRVAGAAGRGRCGVLCGAARRKIAEPARGKGKDPGILAVRCALLPGARCAPLRRRRHPRGAGGRAPLRASPPRAARSSAPRTASPPYSFGLRVGEAVRHFGISTVARDDPPRSSPGSAFSNIKRPASIGGPHANCDRALRSNPNRPRQTR